MVVTIGTMKIEIQHLPTLTMIVSSNPYAISSAVTPRELRQHGEECLRKADEAERMHSAEKGKQ